MKALDLQTELNALGIRFEPIGYVKAPEYPYGIYVDEIEIRQADTPEQVRTATHDVTIELYHKDITELNASARKIDAWINALSLNCRKRTSYVIGEDHYCRSFTLNYKNKERDDLT